MSNKILYMKIWKCTLKTKAILNTFLNILETKVSLAGNKLQEILKEVIKAEGKWSRGKNRFYKGMMSPRNDMYVNIDFFSSFLKNNL